VQTLFEALEHASEAIILDKKKQLFLRFAVMIESSEADIGCAGDVAHGSRVVILLGEDSRGIAENKLQLLIVLGKVLHRTIGLGSLDLGLCI
jgi:hypothetical protein